MFKVGDWVTCDYTGEEHPYKIINETILKYCTNGSRKNVKLWQPEIGEWCWFRTEACQYPELRKFECMHTFKTNKTVYMSYDTEYYEYCEPFISELSSFLKDKQ